MRLGIRQRPETLVLFLTGSVPQCQLDGLAVELNVGHIVVKDGWLLWGCERGGEGWRFGTAETSETRMAMRSDIIPEQRTRGDVSQGSEGGGGGDKRVRTQASAIMMPMRRMSSTYVELWKLAQGKDIQQRRLSRSTVADNDELSPDLMGSEWRWEQQQLLREEELSAMWAGRSR